MPEAEKKEFILIFSTVFLAVTISIILLHFNGIRAAILGLLLVPCCLISYQYPPWGLLAFLTYLPFSGTIAYSVAGIFQAVNARIFYGDDYLLFHFAKDVFYFPALLGILIGSRSLRELVPKIKPLIVALGIFLSLCLFVFLSVNLPQQFSGQTSQSLLVGTIGLKILLGYIPLLLCAYALIRQPQDLIFLNRWLVVLTLICCSLCLIQYLLLVKGICAGNASLPDPASTRATLQAQCFVGGSVLYNPARGLIRLPGTFASPWHWAWFLVASSFLAYGTSVSEPCRPWQAVSWTALGSILVATLISGQRTALLLVPLILLILLLLTERRKRWLSVKLAVITILAAILAKELSIFGRQIEDLIARWNYSPPLEFIGGQFHWLVSARLEWFGHGLGMATNAARKLGSVQLIETFYVKLLYEVGILGCLAFLGVATSLTILTFRAYRSLRNPSLRRFGLCLWSFILFISYNPYHYPLSIDPIVVYYWFFAGILLKLPELDRQIESGKKFDVSADTITPEKSLPSIEYE